MADAIQPDHYLALVDFMDKGLSYGSGVDLRDAIRNWRGRHAASIPAVLADIDALLTHPYSDEALAQFLTQHCDFTYEGSAREMLRFMESVLAA